MRRRNGQFATGTTGNPLGRPKRADEQFLVDLWSKHGQQQFSNAIARGERWALKVLVDKLYANKRHEESGAMTEVLAPVICFDKAFENRFS
jgi:hypothetical protein